jgi:hypothetical protein
MNWVNVEDSLPDLSKPNGGESEDVLIFDGENIGIGYYESEYHIEDDPDAYEGQATTYSSDCWHSTNHLNRDVCGWPEVTHWMPLPKPPKQK